MTDEKHVKVSFPETSFGDDGIEQFGLRFEPDNEEPFPSNSVDDLKEQVSPQVLTDEESRKLLIEHKNYLKSLIAKKYEDLQSMGFHRINGSSLRSIISEKLDRSNMSLQKLEADITEATEDLTDYSEHNFDGHLEFDFDEQQRALDISRREERREEEADSDQDSFALPPQYQQAVPATSRKVPLSDGVSVPLRGASESWQAIRNECTTSMTCSGCQTKLHVIEDAEYVVCPDCWTAGPLEQSLGGFGFEMDGCSDNYGLGLGLPENDIVQWVEKEMKKREA